MTRRYVCTWCGANATPSDPKANAAAIQAHIRSCPKLAEHVAEAVAAEREAIERLVNEWEPDAMHLLDEIRARGLSPGPLPGDHDKTK